MKLEVRSLVVGGCHPFLFALQRQHYENNMFAGKKAYGRDYFATVTRIAMRD